MERLTKKSKTTDMILFIDKENNNLSLEPCEMTSYHNRLAVEKLFDYETKEENGLILYLPCKIDSEVWKIVNQRDNFSDELYKIVTRVNFSLEMLKDFGKTIFLTQKEAQEKIQEIKVV